MTRQDVVDGAVFDRFWDEVLGDDWCIEEGVYPSLSEDGQPDRGPVVEVYAGWQGSGEPPEHIPFFGQSDGADMLVDDAFWRWRKADLEGRVVLDARFEIPKGDVDAIRRLRDEIKRLGGSMKEKAD